jgi:predicted anti-sigma-YlaC factor YlaD
MAMNDHEKIRELLALAVADALTRAEEEQVMKHVRSCSACSSELDSWRLLAAGMRRLPTPQPRPLIVERARARAEIRFAEEAEHRWHRIVMIGVILFAWALTLMSWPVVRLVSGGLLGMLDPRLNHAWLGFAVFTTIVWMTGGAAAVFLSLQQRRERRLA